MPADAARLVAREIDLDALLAEWDDRDAGYVGVLPRSIERLHFNDLAALIRERLRSARLAGRREGLREGVALAEREESRASTQHGKASALNVASSLRAALSQEPPR